MDQNRVEPGELRFGPAGWSYPDWNGCIYSPRDRPLELLAGVFDTIEINASFYRIPTAAMTSRWREQVAANPRFEFTAKLWRGLTHEREPDRAAVTAFTNALRPLRDAGRLGAILAQFPMSFRLIRETWEFLRWLVEALAGWPLVVEVRHRSWEREDVRPFLDSRGVGWCNIDQPPLRDCLGPSAHVTGGIGYVRLHGRNATDWFRMDAGRDTRYDYLYSVDELLPWVERIRAVAAAAQRVFVVTNNHFRGSAIVNALELRERCGFGRVEVPELWRSSFPRLGAITAPQPVPQPTLFAC